MRTGPPVDRWRPLTNTLFSKCCTMAKKEVNQKATVPKTVGMSIRMFVDAETGDYLYRVAKEATFAENALWNLWRMNDPVTYRDVLRMNQEREATGKWPKLPEYKLANTPDGDSPTKIAGNLCPSLWSFVYDAVANQVRKFYSKQRWEILWGKRRLQLASDLRIRFRKRAIPHREWTDRKVEYRTATLSLPVYQGKLMLSADSTIPDEQVACWAWLEPGRILMPAVWWHSLSKESARQEPMVHRTCQRTATE